MPAFRSSVAFFLSACYFLSVHAWKDGRSTWFDVHENELKTANCHMSWNQISTGRYAAAMSDVNPLFSSSCGMCLEIRCQDATFKDGYGESLDRSHACRDSRSVFVTVADACPCKYPNNAYSNKRWCCGDDPSRSHIDITRDAFNQLASLQLGVIGIQWRIVNCSTRKPTDGSEAASPAPVQSTPVPLPPAQESDQSFDHSPFTTSAGAGSITGASGTATQQAAQMQRDTMKRAIDALSRAKERVNL